MSKVLTFNNKMLYRVASDKLVGWNYDQYNPLKLPDLTIRVKMMPGQTLTALPYWGIANVTPVQGQADVYDVCTTGFRTGNNWYQLFQLGGSIKEVLGANSTNVTNMSDMFGAQQQLTDVALFDTSNVTEMQAMFDWCTSLSSVPLFNTSNVTLINSMFDGCISLSSIPLYDTSNVTDMSNMCLECSSLSSIPLFNTTKVTSIDAAFDGCVSVQSGALALYQQASTQANVPSHQYTFAGCGINTVQGAAELAQIPSDWK